MSAFCQHLDDIIRLCSEICGTRRERNNKMEEMTNPTPEEQAQCSPAVNQRAQKKAQRKEKKARYKQIRKELRQKKKEAYQARTALGKFCYMSRKILSFLVALALLVTVIRVNYKEIYFSALNVYYTAKSLMSGNQAEITREQVLEISPLDEERGARIDDSAPLDEGETWAIYMYMVGSDLEARYTSQLTEATRAITKWEALPLKEAREAQQEAHIKDMVNTILANGLDLPNACMANR